MSDGIMILGGYFVPMSAARDLGTDLGLNVGEDFSLIYVHLQNVFNRWLVENNRFHILAAVITWPQPLGSDAGIIFICKFVQGQLENEILEDAEALEVKNDIERWSQTLKLPLRWISFADHRGITRRGTRPRPDQLSYVQGSFAEIMARYNRSGATG